MIPHLAQAEEEEEEEEDSLMIPGSSLFSCRT